MPTVNVAFAPLPGCTRRAAAFASLTFHHRALVGSNGRCCMLRLCCTRTLPTILAPRSRRRARARGACLHAWFFPAPPFCAGLVSLDVAAACTVRCTFIPSVPTAGAYHLHAHTYPTGITPRERPPPLLHRATPTPSRPLATLRARCRTAHSLLRHAAPLHLYTAFRCTRSCTQYGYASRIRRHLVYCIGATSCRGATAPCRHTLPCHASRRFPIALQPIQPPSFLPPSPRKPAFPFLQRITFFTTLQLRACNMRAAAHYLGSACHRAPRYCRGSSGCPQLRPAPPPPLHTTPAAPTLPFRPLRPGWH